MSIQMFMRGGGIFVYGTLMPGFLRYPYIEPYVLSKFRNAFVRGYKMYTGGDFPWIVRTDNLEDKVYGVLLTFEDPEMLEETDLIELGAGYTRVQEPVVVDQSEGEFGLEDEGFEAWVYTLDKPYGGALIESGRWR